MQPISNQQELPRLARRKPNAHKGDFGLAMIVGGSRGMAGAVALAGMAALRGGAGLVRLAVPEGCLDVVAAHEPSYMTIALPQDAEGRIADAAQSSIVQWARLATVVACGPGLGRCDALTALVGWLYQNLATPMVFDADALFALAAAPDALKSPGGPRILTPHPGEFARLLGGRRVPEEERPAAAVAFARQYGAVLVLKGHRTCITDGQTMFVNGTGNPGMATGGSGDVLTGLITSLACQGLAPLAAARLGVHLHGVAGDLAAAALGETSLIASDLVRYLPEAFRAMGEGKS